MIKPSTRLSWIECLLSLVGLVIGLWLSLLSAFGLHLSLLLIVWRLLGNGFLLLICIFLRGNSFWDGGLFVFQKMPWSGPKRVRELLDWRELSFKRDRIRVWNGPLNCSTFVDILLEMNFFLDLRVWNGAMTDNIFHLLAALNSLDSLHLINQCLNFIAIVVNWLLVYTFHHLVNFCYPHIHFLLELLKFLDFSW